MAEYAISYNYSGSKSRYFYDRTFPTKEKAKTEVKELMKKYHYTDFIIAELQPVISVKMPAPSWVEIKKTSE